MGDEKIVDLQSRIDREAAAGEPIAYALRRLDELSAAPRPAVVQGLGADQGAVVAIVGAPNSGKTAFAIDLGLAVSTRCERWLDRKVAGGPVLYFAAEAPGSVRARAIAARQRKYPGARPPFYISAAAPGLGSIASSDVDTARVLATVHAVEETEGDPVKMVFADTLASCLGDGEENGDGMLRLVQAAKLVATRTQACVVLIHHPSKGDASGLRGHGSLAAACDAILRIDVEDLTGVRIATLVKARDDATGLQLRFELEQVVLEDLDSFGDARKTIVVKQAVGAAPRPRPTGARQQELLYELERRYRAGEQHWDEAGVHKAGRDLGMPRNSPRDALKGLQSAGYIVGSAAHLTLKYPPEECTK